MVNIVEISNPFEPLKDVRTSQHDGGISIRDWLRLRFGPEFVEFDRPTICILNGKPVLRRDWDGTVLGDNDVLNFVTTPGAPLVMYIFMAIMVVAAVVLAVTMRVPTQATAGSTPEGDPVYTLKGQQNKVRLGEPIEAAYGRVRLWPSYAAMPYNRYSSNQQWLYQLFCLGQGKLVVDSVNIEDTPVSEFEDVAYEIVPPGGMLTLFPDNIVTSIEVNNIELFGPNEPEGNAVPIEDSPGDSNLGIGATGHLGYSLAGPFVVNPAQTRTNLLEFDVSLPRGLYNTNTQTGDLINETVTGEFQARPIDDNGVATGAWTTVATFTRTLNTVTPQRYTLTANVASGRYEVRAFRTNNKNTDAKSGNQLNWEAVRAALPSTRTYGNVTMLALKARATNNLNSNASSRVNVIATRIVEVYNGLAWVESPTRSIVWAFCDIFRAQYGGRIEDQFLALDDLLALDAVYTARGEFFDWIFDQRTTCLDAARLVANVGRAIPIPNGSRLTMIRDEPKTLPTAIFNQENIVKGSFRWEIKLHSPDASDGLEVTYNDRDTWKEETVLCCLPGESGDNPDKLKLYGVTDRTHAYRWGMWKRALARYQRENITFQTGMEGHIPSYGDLIGVTHDLPRWGSGGLVLAMAGNDLTLSEPVTFDGVSVYKVILRKRNGSATVPVTVTPGADAYHIVTATPFDASQFCFDENAELPLFNFGKSDLVSRYCKVYNLSPEDGDTVEVTCAPERPEPYAFDEYVPPPKGQTSGYLPGPPALPVAQNLLVTKSPSIANEVVASWSPVSGALYYILQLSYDGTSWETISDYIEATNFRFTVLPKFIYVRLAAITTGAGPWAYWTGLAPVATTTADNGATPNGVTNVVLTSGFGLIWLQWANSTNGTLKATHIYASQTAIRPATPQFTIPVLLQQFGHNGLHDAETWNYWFAEETLGGKFSTVSGPYTATTTNGITLDHLIPGGIVPPEIKTVLPSTGNFQGRLVYLTADDSAGGTFLKDKLYRWTNPTVTTGKADWTATVPSGDISGALTGTQIANGAISTPKLTTGAVTANELAANAVTAGKIQAGAITAAAIGTNEIVANTANIKDGVITDAKIASLSANKITATSLSAISATIGLLRTATTGARLEIESNQLRVYDASNVLRVRLGIW